MYEENKMDDENKFLKQILRDNDKELTQVKNNYHNLLEENKQLKFILSKKDTDKISGSKKPAQQDDASKIKEENERLKKELNELKSSVLPHLKEELSKTKEQNKKNISHQQQLELYKNNYTGIKFMRSREEVIKQLEMDYLKENPGASLINPNFDPNKGYDEMD